jgi:glycosyltransferase involved in cell wall biosynthesis
MPMSNKLEQPLLSIIVPFYNVEKYFGECLDSIVNQSYPHLEIILIDDCSPDGSLAIAKEYAAKDSRITIIRHSQNKRQGGARNTGLAAATGDYIWFIDSDDKMLYLSSVQDILDQAALHNFPDMIGFGCLNVYEKHQVTDACLHQVVGAQLFNARSAIENYLFRLNTHPATHSPLEGYMWHKWFKRDFLVALATPLLEHTVYEDIIATLFVLQSDSLLVLQAPHYYYRKRAGSTMSSSYPADFAQHLTRIFKQWMDFRTRYFAQQLPISYWYWSYLQISPSSIVGEAWRAGMAKQLKTQPHVLNELVKTLQDLLHDAPTIADVAAVAKPLGSRYTGYQQEQMEHLISSKNASPTEQWRLLNSLYTPRHNALKKTLATLLPHALYAKLLAKRGWRITIEKA